MNIALDSKITAHFSEAMDPTTLNDTTFILRQDTLRIPGTLSVTDSSATLTPDGSLTFSSVYTAIITTGARDLLGNNIATQYQWQFTTSNKPFIPDTTAPQVTSVTPANGAQDVSVNAVISATFSEPMDASTIDKTSFQVSQDGSIIDGSITYTNNTATFTPKSPLNFGTPYSVLIATTVKDTAGNSLANSLNWGFTTSEEPDNTPPSISSTEPTDRDQNVSIQTKITATFDEGMDPASINTSTFKLQEGNRPISGTVDYSGTIATFIPTEDLNFNTTYTATITKEVTDLAGNHMSSDYSWTFTTAQETTPPTVTSTSPADNATDVQVNTAVFATFSEPMAPATINSNTFILSQAGTLIKGNVSYSGTTAIFTPASDLPFGSTFTATVTTSAKDLAGNSLQDNKTWTFTTIKESSPPTVASTNPVNNAQNVAVNSDIAATFSEEMASSTINNNTLKINKGGAAISGTVSYSGKTATFSPDQDLDFSSTYIATVTTGVQDLAGNPMTKDYSWSFTTGKEPDNTAPQIVSTDPANNAGDVSVNTTISATFSEAMSALRINAPGTFTITQNGTTVNGTISYSGNTAIFNPSDNLSHGTTYTATITTNAEDLAGNKLPSNYSWTFTTVQETTPPTIISTSPADNASNAQVNTAISVTFSESMDPATINTNTFILSQNGNSISGSVTYSGTTVIFIPSSDLNFNATYTATITTGVTDLAGNHMSNNYSWSFTTAQETIPPTVISSSPADNATDVQANKAVSVTFSESMDPATINTNTFTLSQNGTPVSGSVSYSGTTATFTPSSDLAYNTTFTATISTGVTDLAGNHLSNNYSWSFTTAQETIPPTVISSSPADNATGVQVNKTVSVTFSESMDPATINTNTFTLSQNGTPVSGSVSYSGTTATFTPSSDLAYNTTFTATITTGVTDLAGNHLSNNYSWSFTTAQETIPPTVASTSPPDNATGVQVNKAVSVTFSESMDPATINTNTFTLSQNGTPVSGRVSYSGTTATFTPSSDLAYNTTFTATISTGVTDLAGNHLSNNYSWSFTTAQETIPPTVASTSPADNATGVQVNKTVSVIFSEELDPSTITNTTFTLSQGGKPVSGSVSYSGTTATFTPSSDLAYNTTFTATISTGVTDLAGNHLSNDYSWTFTTEQETTPPTVASTTPTDGATEIDVASIITVTFSEEMDPSSINDKSFILVQGGTAIKGTVNYSGTTATFTPNDDLAFASPFTATIKHEAKDLAGNHMTSDYSWSFTTAQETTPPTVTSTSPTDGAMAVEINSAISATFSEELDPSTITNTTFTLSQNGSSVSGSVSYSGTTATFTPSVVLAYNTTFTATITTGVTDLAGNHLSNNYSWTFTTAQETTPPTVASTSPKKDAKDVLVSTVVSATFSEDMDLSTINSTNFTLNQGGTPVSGTISYSSGTTVNFIPSTDLAYNTTFTATITTGVTDLAGNHLSNNYSWTFTTAQETTPPTVASTSPTDGATDVDSASIITATFSEEMDPTSINDKSFILVQGGTAIKGTVNYSGTTATFTPNDDLAFASPFTATIKHEAKDLAGNHMTSDYSWSFTTAQETTPPTVISTSPTNGATGIQVNTTVSANFSEDMDPSTITNTTFTLSQGDTLVFGTVTYSGTTATFTPSIDLDFNATYTATISSNVTDLAGNHLSKNYSWTFTSEPTSTTAGQ